MTTQTVSTPTAAGTSPAATATGPAATGRTAPGDAAAGPTPTVRINPSGWSAAFGYDQGQLRPYPTQLLTIAGQGPVDESGCLLHAGDISAQLSLAMANVEAVLAGAGMDVRDITRLTIYTTDVDATLAAYGALLERLVPRGATPPATLLGITRLAIPDMAVELDVTAVR